MDAILYSAKRNSGSIGTFGILADAAGALHISLHISMTHFQLLCPGASSGCKVAGELRAPLGVALDSD